MSVPIQFDAERAVVLSGGRSLVFHCHFYNCALQRAIEEGMGERAPKVLTEGAARAIHAQLTGLGDAIEDIPAFAEAAFRELGFGLLDLSGVGARGGAAKVQASHYAMGWTAVHGPRETPACFFPAGFIQGAVAVAHGLPLESVTVEERGCYAAGAEDCVFDVRVSEGEVAR
ncbi:MAG: V4R domain-containing protein [Myxococcota bacterium]|nr:V4R domain-containing protein [Myxococcota bacterium]